MLDLDPISTAKPDPNSKQIISDSKTITVTLYSPHLSPLPLEPPHSLLPPLGAHSHFCKMRFIAQNQAAAI
jgi:hypothetical protein